MARCKHRELYPKFQYATGRELVHEEFNGDMEL